MDLDLDFIECQVASLFSYHDHRNNSRFHSSNWKVLSLSTGSYSFSLPVSNFKLF